MSEIQADILRNAIVRNAAAVLSLPSAGILRHYKSRFLAEADHEGTPAIWVESNPAERLLVDELIAIQRPAAISFKIGTNKIVFLTPIVLQELEHRINADTVLTAILMRWPGEMKSIQRRANYRVRFSPTSEAMIRVWRIPDHVYLGDRPLATQEIDAQLRDLSTGGVGVTFLPQKDQPVKVSIDDRLRIQLTFPEMTILVEGRMKYPTQVPKVLAPVKAGIEFKPLHSDLEGRQKLAQLSRIIGEMQREEVRRMRLGLAG